jgi:predicted membrane protein
MTTTLFIICLILAAVLVTVSPVFSIPFLLGAYLIAKFGDMSMESNRSIIAGIIGFIFFLAIIVKIMDWIRH